MPVLAGTGPKLTVSRIRTESLGMLVSQRKFLCNL
jgi:hypothetical protein